jgi:hypothetical protein
MFRLVLLYSQVHLIMGKAANVSHFLYEVLVAHPIIDEGHHHLQQRKKRLLQPRKKKKNVKKEKNLCSSAAAFQTDKMRV